MLIRGKPFSEWDISDIESIVGDQDYAENESIDYKVTCAILEASDKESKRERKTEFRHDVCAFANADGGYLFFGIAENKGTPSKVVGISLPCGNPDQFELDRRNDLSTIFPAPPEVRFRFLPMADGKNYIVILEIGKGRMVPYVYREDNDKYRFYVRRGNGKQPCSYNEVQKMFREGLVLQEEIEKFRQRRLEYLYTYRIQKNEPFAVIQIVPANFLSANQWPTPPMLALRKDFSFALYFSGLYDGLAIPTIDGLSYRDISAKDELLLYNNHAVELDILMDKPSNGTPLSSKLFQKLKKLIPSAVSYYLVRNICTKCYICVSVLGCFGVGSDLDMFDHSPRTIIDRNEIICPPTEISDITNESVIKQAVIYQALTTCMALGITNTQAYCGYSAFDLTGL